MSNEEHYPICPDCNVIMASELTGSGEFMTDPETGLVDEVCIPVYKCLFCGFTIEIKPNDEDMPF